MGEIIHVIAGCDILESPSALIWHQTLVMKEISKSQNFEREPDDDWIGLRKNEHH